MDVEVDVVRVGPPVQHEADRRRRLGAAPGAPRRRPSVSRKKSPPNDAERGPFNAAFSGLTSLRDALPSQERPEPRSAPPAKGPARAVVRYERKGRGGKEATVVEQLALSPRERAEWLLAMKQALGCGGTLEGEALVLQGDQRSRVRGWLEARGVSRISVG